MFDRVRINKFLFDIGIRKILPAEYIRRIKINECGESLIKVSKYVERTECKNINQIDGFYIRSSVVEKLEYVQNKIVQEGYKLELLSAYRSKEEQTKLWEQEYQIVYNNNANLEISEIERLTSLKVANPQKGFGGHQTGGAIDITLCYSSGERLDMGTNYLEFSEKTFTSSKDISKDAIKNRKRLLFILEQEMFVNYPSEWWHFSFGDALWAAYLKKFEAIYGVV